MWENRNGDPTSIDWEASAIQAVLKGATQGPRSLGLDYQGRKESPGFKKG